MPGMANPEMVPRDHTGQINLHGTTNGWQHKAWTLFTEEKSRGIYVGKLSVISKSPGALAASIVGDEINL